MSNTVSNQSEAIVGTVDESTEKTFIKGKDRDLESTIDTMLAKLNAIGIEIEEASWLNPVPNVYSVHIRDKDCELMFTNGKGATRKACLASALGEYFERLSCNYFFADFYLGETFSDMDFIHYPDERWFEVTDDTVPDGLLDETLWNYYDPEQQITAAHLYDVNSGAGVIDNKRGICALPYTRLRDAKSIWFPVSVIGNIYVSVTSSSSANCSIGACWRASTTLSSSAAREVSAAWRVSCAGACGSRSWFRISSCRSGTRCSARRPTRALSSRMPNPF